MECAAALDPDNLDSIAAAMTLAHIEMHIGNEKAASDGVKRLLPALVSEELLQRYAKRATLYIQVYRLVEILVRQRPDSSVTRSDPGHSVMLGQMRELVDRVSRLNESSDNSALARALMLLARSLIAISEARLGRGAASDIDLAVSEIRQSGQRPWLVTALLIRARLLRHIGALDSGTSSLSEARSLCLVDGMVIALLDCDYEAAMIAIAGASPWQGHIMLDSLSSLADRQGYGRMSAEVARLLLAHVATRKEPGPGSGIDEGVDG